MHWIYLKFEYNDNDYIRKHLITIIIAIVIVIVKSYMYYDQYRCMELDSSISGLFLAPTNTI